VFGIPFTMVVNTCLTTVSPSTVRNSSTSQCTQTNLPLVNSASLLQVHTIYEAGSSTSHTSHQLLTLPSTRRAQLTIIQRQLPPPLLLKMTHRLLMHLRQHDPRRHINHPKPRILHLKTLKQPRRRDLPRSIRALTRDNGVHCRARQVNRDLSRRR
jgi:hypothetical protein